MTYLPTQKCNFFDYLYLRKSIIITILPVKMFNQNVNLNSFPNNKIPFVYLQKNVVCNVAENKF